MPDKRLLLKSGPCAVAGLLLLLLFQKAPASEVVAFPSGDKMLHGLLYKPAGQGPFPAVLYNHGSAPGLLSNQAFDLIGPRFVARGWPYRRGQGLSAEAGTYIGEEIQAARKARGLEGASHTAARLLSSEQLDDQMAALDWLKKQQFVRSDQIAADGNSFGGVETLLGAAQGAYCAAVDASGAAQGWEVSPDIRELMRRAVQDEKTPPVLFIQARNDYTTAPSHELYQAMRSAGKVAEIRIYPPYGQTAEDGHSFAYRGVSTWFEDVFHFLHSHCQK